MLLEKAQAVGDRVANRDAPRGVHRAGDTDLHLSVAVILGDPTLQLLPRLVGNALHVEAQSVTESAGCLILHRDSAVDPVPAALKRRLNGLPNLKRTRLVHLENHVEGRDLETSLSLEARRGPAKNQDAEPQSQGEVPATGARVHSRSGSYRQELKSTLGTARSASSTSKNSRSLKPNVRATTLDGMEPTLVL